MVEALLATPWVFLCVPGNFLLAALLTQCFGLSKSTYGVIASMPAWANAAQLLVVPLLTRWMRPKAMTICFSWANFALWIALLAALPFIPRDDPTRAGRWFLGFFALAAATHALIGVGWTAWVQEWTPPRVRGKYFGQRNGLMSVVTVAFLLLSWAALRGRGEDVSAYLALFVLAMGLRIFSIWLSQKIVAPVEEAAGAGARWLGEIGALLRDRPFVIFTIFGAVTGFFMNLTGPFVPVFMFEHLHLPPARVNLLMIVATLAGAFAIPVWGKLIDRHGARPILLVCLIAWETQNLLWVVLTPSLAWLLYPMFLWGGLTSSGFFLGVFNLLLKLVSREGRTAGVSLYVGATSLATGAAPVIAGLLLGWAVRTGLEVELFYRGGFLLRSVGLLLSALLIVKIREPETRAVFTVLGALRTFRQSMAAQGLAFLGNQTLARRRGR